MSVNSKMTAIADEIRELSGTTGAMGLDAMATHIGEANTEIDSQVELLAQAVATLEGKAASSADTSVEDSLIAGDICVYENDRVTTIRQAAFASCSSLVEISFPKVTSIGAFAFQDCYGLLTASFPAATYIGEKAFAYCSSIATASFPAATTVGYNAFQYCRNLTTASFPAVTSIGGSAFMGCSSLTTVSFPKAVLIGTAAFMNCSSLTAVSFPKAGSISKDAFARCAELTTASFPQATIIHNQAFSLCYNLKSLYLTNSSVCTLSASAAFFSTPIGGYSASAGTYGSIYVPASLLTSYKNATNWTYFSSRFVGI